jgi:2-polyprenyl-6-methoxyphenol hydroxylase-like FAD-dependent oxidoreductase
MERCLREAIASQPESELRSGSTICEIEESTDNVIVTYITSTGEKTKIRAKFFVGADGKTGFTRKKYLEPKGITMEKSEKQVELAAWGRQVALTSFIDSSMKKRGWP